MDDYKECISGISNSSISVKARLRARLSPIKVTAHTRQRAQSMISLRKSRVSCSLSVANPGEETSVGICASSAPDPICREPVPNEISRTPCFSPLSAVRPFTVRSLVSQSLSASSSSSLSSLYRASSSSSSSFKVSVKLSILY